MYIALKISPPKEVKRVNESNEKDKDSSRLEDEIKKLITKFNKT